MQRPDDYSTGPSPNLSNADPVANDGTEFAVSATAGLITPAATPDDQDISPLDSPGQYLRRSREARRMELGHVATELRLPPETIDAIERDAYAGLPDPVFVAGYVRGYARLLGLDQDALMEGFRRLHPSTDPPAPRIATGGAEGGSGWLVGLVSVLIAAALLGGVWLWWDHREGDGARTPFAGRATAPPSPTEDDAADTQRATETETETAAADTARGGWFLERWLRPPPAATDADADDSTATATTDTAAPAAAATPAVAEPAPLPYPETPEQPAAPVDTTLPALATLPEPPSAPTPTAAPIPTPDPEPTAAVTDTDPPADTPPEVVLSFSGPCWVDIRDATGTVRLSGEMRDGDRHVLDGEPPFSLILGNAAAASVEVGGQPFDVRAIARGNVARFRLDPAEVIAAANADSD